RNPKFKDSDTSLRKFDIVVANPMWNQPFDPDVFENDPFDRFLRHGGITTGKGDCAWLQHTLASLKDTGRAAVVIDTGAVTRGSGSKHEDKERNIRKWFVANDLIDGVILLPDNLFYNTPAGGIIIILRKNKPKDRQGKIVLVNASQQFRKGTPKNYLPGDAVKKIAEAFLKAKPEDGFVGVITNEEAIKNDFNLSPTRYLASGPETVIRDIPTILRELKQVESEADAIREQLTGILKKL